MNKNMKVLVVDDFATMSKKQSFIELNVEGVSLSAF